MSTPSPTLPPEDFDPRARRLCPDGACIGVLDENNRCKECGRVDADAAPAAAPAAAAPAAWDENAEGDGDGAPDVDAAPGDAAPDGGFNPGRALCPDGTCVGVIGDNGRCKVCGRGKDS